MQLLGDVAEDIGVRHSDARPVTEVLTDVAGSLRPVGGAVESPDPGDVGGEETADRLVPEERVRFVQDGGIQRGQELCSIANECDGSRGFEASTNSSCPNALRLAGLSVALEG